MSFKVSHKEIQQYLQQTDHTCDIELIEMSQSILKKRQIDSLVNLLESMVEASRAVPASVKELITSSLGPSNLYSEVVPSLKLGRRAGHTTAITSFANKNPKTLIVTFSMKEAKRLSKILENDSQVMFISQFLQRYNTKSFQDFAIFFENIFIEDHPQLLRILPLIYLESYPFFIGN